MVKIELNLKSKEELAAFAAFMAELAEVQGAVVQPDEPVTMLEPTAKGHPIPPPPPAAPAARSATGAAGAALAGAGAKAEPAPAPAEAAPAPPAEIPAADPAAWDFFDDNAGAPAAELEKSLTYDKDVRPLILEKFATHGQQLTPKINAVFAKYGAKGSALDGNQPALKELRDMLRQVA